MIILSEIRGDPIKLTWNQAASCPGNRSFSIDPGKKMVQLNNHMIEYDLKSLWINLKLMYTFEWNNGTYYGKSNILYG